MWIRSAFWIGMVKPGCDGEFRALMDTVLLPGLAALPGVRSASALWPVHREDNPPAIACQVLVAFEDRDSLERMMASAGRRELRPHVAAAHTLFDGTMSHIEYEVAGG